MLYCVVLILDLQIWFGTVCIWTTKAGCCEINQFGKKTSLNVIYEVPWYGKSALVRYVCIVAFYVLLSLWSRQSGAPGSQRNKAENEFEVGTVVLYCSAMIISIRKDYSDNVSFLSWTFSLHTCNLLINFVFIITLVYKMHDSTSACKLLINLCRTVTSVL